MATPLALVMNLALGLMNLALVMILDTTLFHPRSSRKHCTPQVLY